MNNLSSFPRIMLYWENHFFIYILLFSTENDKKERIFMKLIFFKKREKVTIKQTNELNANNCKN